MQPHDWDAVTERITRSNPQRMVAAVDYLVITTDDHGGRTPAGHTGVIELAHGVRIEQLEVELAKRILDACTPRGEDWSPERQFHAVHAYARDAWSEDDGTNSEAFGRWDHSNRIWPTVQMSRLVRDNNASTEFAVQRQIRADETEVLVPFDGFESHVVYRLYPEQEGWLDVDEVAELRCLLEAYWDGPELPERVGRALREADAVTAARYLEYATPWVVGAFETLVKIGRGHISAQFSQRVPAIASEVDIELSREDCAAMYDDRSALVHGAGLDVAQPQIVEALARRFVALQEALRRVIRRAIEDPDFAAHFATDEGITSRWPTVVKVRAGVEKVI